MCSPSLLAASMLGLMALASAPGQPEPAQCARAAKWLLQLERSAPAIQPAGAGSKRRAELLEQCRRGDWREEQIACLGAAKTPDEARSCLRRPDGEAKGTVLPAALEMGSCNQRAMLRVCADVPKDPEARYLCAKNAGTWSSDPCEPADLGNCRVGPLKTLRYYAGGGSETADSARNRCEALRGEWKPTPRPEKPASTPRGAFPERANPYGNPRTHSFER